MMLYVLLGPLLFCTVQGVSYWGDRRENYEQNPFAKNGIDFGERLIERINSDGESPQITMFPKDQKVAEDGTVSFFCKASGIPSPDIYWLKDGRRVSSNQQAHIQSEMQHGSVLRIEPVRAGRDDAVIECVAENGVGEPAVGSAQLDVYGENEVPDGYPRITDSPNLKVVEKNHGAVLLCSAVGDPEPSIVWLRDFIPIDLTNPRYKLLPNGYLQILNSQLSDQGKYECLAENSKGVAYSYQANLYVRVRFVQPHFTIKPESVEVMKGNAVNLTCVAAGEPMPYVKWRLNGVDLTPEDSIPLGKNVLMLTDVGLKESGNYTCIASSRLGNIEAVAEVQVKDPPQITLAPRDHKVSDNGIVSFFCKASGTPAPNIYWLKGGKRVTSRQGSYIQEDMPHGSVLRIEPVTAKRDDDVFECVANNGVGQPAVSSAQLNVYAEDEALPSGYPSLTESPTLKAVEKDRSTVMLCSAIGNPDPTIMWLKDFIPVDLTDPRLKLLPSGSLQILYSQESDEGKYECVAENSKGVVYSYGANLYVRVRRFPPYFTTKPESVEVLKGSAVNLTCIATGEPKPYVKWTLDDVDLTPEDSIPLEKNVLILTNIQESGNYTCVAASQLGNIEAIAEVKIKGRRI